MFAPLRLTLLLLVGTTLTACATSVPAKRTNTATGKAVEAAATNPLSDVARSTPRTALTGGALTVVSVEPSSDTALTEDSVISVVLDYRISNMRRGLKYGIAPFFADRRGSGAQFCALNDLTAALQIVDSHGRVELHYPIRAEWRGGRLALPPSVWFDLIEQSQSSQRVLVEVGPFSFQ